MYIDEKCKNRVYEQLFVKYKDRYEAWPLPFTRKNWWGRRPEKAHKHALWHLLEEKFSAIYRQRSIQPRDTWWYKTRGVIYAAKCGVLVREAQGEISTKKPFTQEGPWADMKNCPIEVCPHCYHEWLKVTGKLEKTKRRREKLKQRWEKYRRQKAIEEGQ